MAECNGTTTENTEPHVSGKRGVNKGKSLKAVMQTATVSTISNSESLEKDMVAPEEKNINVNNKVDNGGNALLLVCNCYKKENLIDIVQFLVEKNIDINCKDDKGCNALHLVCFNSPKPLLNDLVRLLVQHLIDKEAKTSRVSFTSSLREILQNRKSF
ncbi:hypothetical protein DAPPUDRAFT_327678 [Daphnia pulex]|uniref:Uncharacterized protein n=1 Tax=Daphnia pulex TaxID=6669 RepID=E9HBE3_DAPPU|nr:hypothetical protein DAPPUDRAFT_327678 [Daphnia pulex]|eukprot:EFX70950.1 hypothetical protein DAPPUDRAFT_327678 [Daphnia pulex]